MSFINIFLARKNNEYKRINFILSFYYKLLYMKNLLVFITIIKK